MRERSAWLILGVVFGLWLLVGLVLAPTLVEFIYRSDVVPAMSLRPLSFFLGELREIVFVGAAAGVAVGLFIRALRTSAFADRFVPNARPSDVGAIRALVAGVLLISTLWEDLSSSAALPRELMNPSGVMDVLAAFPGYYEFTSSALALGLFKWCTALTLLFAAAGWKTRLTVPLGAVLYLILGGLLRQYAWFYHTGLIPLYLLAALAFLPSGEGLSVDRWLQRRRGEVVEADVPSRRFGWARYALWLVMAVPYVAAGLSKMRNGGADWWDAANFKYIALLGTLRPMEFDFQLSLGLTSAPDWFIEALALSAVLGEVLYGLVLVSRRARWIMPTVMLLMHIGILVLQNILFFDLIVLQLIFFNVRPLLQHLAGVGSMRSALARALRAGDGTVGAAAMGRRTGFAVAPRQAAGRRVSRVFAVVLVFCWVFRVEFYPFTGMQMFSTKRTEPLVYEVAFAHLESGEIVRAPIEKSIGAMSDGRYRRVLQMAFDPGRSSISAAFAEVTGERWNRQQADGHRIEAIEIQRWEWFFLSEPDDPNHGRLVDRVVYTLNETMD